MTAKTALVTRTQDGGFHLESRVGPLAHLMIVQPDLPRACQYHLERHLYEALIVLGIEPLSFKDIEIVWERGTKYAIYFGRTSAHDREWQKWNRRTLAEYVLGGNPIPQVAVAVLERLQTAHFPIGCSISVWEPFPDTAGEQVPQELLLVLELSNGSCFALCRWNG